MRNLKRALSLALAVIMVLGLMIVGAGAVSYNDFSDREEIVNKDAVSMLTTLGIIDGMPDGSYAPEEGVDRAMMAKMISVIMNQGVDNSALYTSTVTGLTDVSSSWAKGHINFCYTRKIIAGRGNNTFDPTAGVTAVEAAKMLLVAAGYDPAIEGFEGAEWAINVNAKASALGIFRNFNKDVTLPLNRDDAALLIYNALDVEMIQKYENGYAIAFTDHRTILSTMYGVYKVEGVVVANEWAQLQKTNSDAALREGKTTLENVVVYSSTTANTTTGEGVAESAPVTFNVSTPVDMMGKTVTLYIEKTTILSNSKVLGVATKDDVNVINTTVATQSSSSSYLKGTGVSVGKNTEFYVNYGICDSENAAMALINAHTTYSKSNKFNLNGIDVEVIDNNDDGVAEYVLYTLETLSEVRTYSVKNETISFYTPYDEDGNLATGKTAVTAKADFDDVVFNDEVTTDDLILYVQYGGRTYISAPEIVTGKMTRVDRDKDNELYITVEGTEYRQSFILDAASLVDVDLTHFDIGNANKEPGFDTSYDFILDSTGKYVVAIRPAEETVTNYALVLESAWTQNALTKSGQVKVLKVDGTEATYELNWKGTVGSGKAFATDAALEDYLGTRDVLGGRTTGAAIGTVITYALSDDNVLTIKNVMNLNDLDSTTGNFKTVDDASKPVAYMASNNAASMAQNLQYTLTSKYDAGNGTLNVTDSVASKTHSYAVDRNTIAFYYVDSKNYGVAIGWDHMGDVSANAAAQVYPVMQKDGMGGMTATNLVELVLFNSVPESDSNNYMLVLNRNAYTSSTALWLNVVFEDGTAKEIQIKNDGGYNFNDEASYMKAYAYSENADGTYTVVSKVVANADAYLIKNGTVAWGTNAYYTLPDSASVWDVTDVTSAKDEVVKGTFTYNDVNAVVIPTGNKQTVRTAWIWDKDEGGSTTNPTLPTAYTPVIESSANGVITIRKYAGDTLSSQQIAKIIREQLTDVKVDKVAVKYDTTGSKYVATVTDTTGDEYYYEVAYKNLAKIEYNGVTKFMAQNETLTVSSYVLAKSVDGSGNVTYTKQTTGIVGTTYTQPAVSGTTTDLVLVDGYAVVKAGGASVTYKTQGGKTVTAHSDTNDYIAAGDVIVMSGADTERYTITKTSDSSVLATYDFTASTTKEFDMPTHGVTVTKSTTPTQVTIKWHSDNASGVLTGTKGSYKMSCDATGETGDVIVVTLETTGVISSQATLTLADTTGSAVVAPSGGITIPAGTEIGSRYSFSVTLGTADVTLKLTEA